MEIRNINLFVVVIVALITSGCASYRTDSNISEPAASSATSTAKVLISEDSLPNRKYKKLGPIEVSVKKLTIFHKDPTKDQANDALVEKAKAIGADAVINVKYESGVGLTTWGYIDAKGTGVKLAD